MSTPFRRPKRTKTESGSERRVGFEIEFIGVGLAATAQLIQQLFGGSVETRHRFKYIAHTPLLGDFSIESDASFVTGRKWEKYLKLAGLDPKTSPVVSSLNGTIEDVVALVSEEFVPFEIASPPIPFSKMHEMERLRQALHASGARGTHAHFFTAFGLQFNPEMPDLRPETMLAYMRAFFLSYDALLASEDIPLARKLLPFIDPFPVEFVERILDPAYAPSLNELMRDYLEQNPTRNRPLDWLPLFAYVDKALVFEYPVEKELIKPRPTLHYRLPSSLIDDPSWTIAGEWNKWSEIDDLANDPSRIETLIRQRTGFAPHPNPLLSLRSTDFS